MRLDRLLDDDPAEVARQLTEAARAAGRAGWTDELARALERHTDRAPLTRWLTSWGVSDAEAGRLFGVTRQAVGKWRTHGVPNDRLQVMAELAAVTDLLEAYVRHDRVRAVVRRPAELLEGRSMLDLVAEGRTAELLAATRHMFDLHRLDAA